MRREKIITLEDDGKKLTLKITQMAASQHEKWQNRLLLLLAKANTDWDTIAKQFKNDDYMSILTVLGTLGYEQVEPLYQELLSCVAHIPDPNNPNFAVPLTPENVDSIIGEWKNLYILRFTALQHEYAFFDGGGPSPLQKLVDIKIGKNM